MSWVQKLYDTYENNYGLLSDENKTKLWPVSHTAAQAHIEIVLDKDGNFKRASVIPKENGMTLMPATEDSVGGRTSGGAPHPLCDKIQYVAGDYASYGGGKKPYFQNFPSKGEMKDGYCSTLGKWTEFSGHPRLKAIYDYIKKECVVKDLVEKAGILHVDQNGKLMLGWSGNGEKPEIFKAITGDDQGDALVRWRVELGVLDKEALGTWEDEDLIESWIQYYETLQSEKGLCCLTGKEAVLAIKHPAKIRNAADNKAKLISSNDTRGFTYRGNFTNSNQAAAMGYEYMQKSYNALRWIIGKQAYRNDDQVIVAWEVTGKDIPSPCKNSHELGIGQALIEKDYDEYEPDEDELLGVGSFSKKESSKVSDTGEIMAHRVVNSIKGGHTEEFDLLKKEYADIQKTDQIIVMGFDSASQGRLSITYYRELFGSEFLDRISSWHKRFTWHQNYAKNLKFTGAPSMRDIAEAAYGIKLDTKLKKATVQRGMPCIIDKTPFPKDLMDSAFHRVCNRVGFGEKNRWEWEKVLGITCALYRGTHEKEDYQMELEENRKTRDYLYGRLLAVAERIENAALYVAGEKRETNAARLMNRFADKPYSTWRLLELQYLKPYKTRLLNKRPGTHKMLCDLLDEIHGLFDPDEYISDGKLGGEFLLGYHCQRRALYSGIKYSKEEMPIESTE